MTYDNKINAKRQAIDFPSSWLALQYFRSIKIKAPSKRTQYCWPTTPNIVGCYMLHGRLLTL